MLPFTSKYAPQNLAEFSQKEVIAKLQLFLSTFKKQKKKAVLLYGLTGTGKTSMIHLLANQLNLEVVEVNASDVRNAEGINAKLLSAAKQRSLFCSGKILLVDEVDGIAGQSDRGGVTALANVMKETGFPMILTANDPFDQKFSSIRKLATLIEFPAPTPADISLLLVKIATQEKLKFDEQALRSLARRCAGDVRAALTDLQILSHDSINQDAIGLLGERDKSEEMTRALAKILKQSDPKLALSAFEHVDEDLDDAFLWLEESLPKEYTNPADLERAFERVSRADVFRGRIMNRQHWRFLAYENDLLTAGVACAKDAPYHSSVEYERSERILKLWIAKQKYAMRLSVAGKVAELCHCSTKRAVQDTLPFLRTIAKKYDVASALDLDDEQTEWLTS